MLSSRTTPVRSTVRGPRSGETIVREITSLQLLSDGDDEVDLMPVMIAKEVDLGRAATVGVPAQDLAQHVRLEHRAQQPAALQITGGLFR